MNKKGLIKNGNPVLKGFLVYLLCRLPLTHKRASRTRSRRTTARSSQVRVEYTSTFTRGNTVVNVVINHLN
jgi:hypothetical protein